MLDGGKSKYINSSSGENVSTMWSLYTEDDASGSEKTHGQKHSTPQDVQGQEIGHSERSKISE